MIELPVKSGFYEQVVCVKGVFVFLFLASLLLFVVVDPHAVLPRVSIRTLSEPLGLCAGWGQKEKSMLPVIGRPCEGPTRRAVIGTRGYDRGTWVRPQTASAWNGTYGSCVTQMRCSRTASFRATATIARLRDCLPPRNPRCKPHRRSVESFPRGPRIWFAHSTRRDRR